MLFFLEHYKYPSEYKNCKINGEHITMAEMQKNHGWEPLFPFSSSC